MAISTPGGCGGLKSPLDRRASTAFAPARPGGGVTSAMARSWWMWRWASAGAAVARRRGGGVKRKPEARPTTTSATTISAVMLLTSRSEEHTSELQSLMRISYAVFCLKKKKTTMNTNKVSMHHKQVNKY